MKRAGGDISIGSVIGRLTMISVRRKPYFTVQDERTRRPVRCNFREKDIENVKEGLGRRVVAFGVMTRNRAGQVLRVDVRSLRAFPDDDSLPTADDIAGSNPDFTGGLDSVAYVRRMRE
jgi:hypothetical protein